MQINRAKQTITFKDGAVHCDAFHNFGHGTHVRVTLKPHEANRLYDHNRARRKRWWKNYRRMKRIEAGGGKVVFNGN